VIAALLSTAACSGALQNVPASPSAGAGAGAGDIQEAWPDWVWGGPEALSGELVALGLGQRRDTSLEARVKESEDSARAAAAARLVDLAGEAARTVSPDALERLRVDLGLSASIAATWTSSTGRVFTQARLRLETGLERLKKELGLSAAAEQAARAAFAALERDPKPLQRTPPAWAETGARIVETPNPGIVAVGAAAGLGNFRLERTTAENRARAAIANAFEELSAVMMQEFVATLKDEPVVSPPPEEVGVSGDVRSFSSAVLNRVAITAGWWDARHNQYYARAELELDPARTAALVPGADPVARTRVERSIARALHRLASSP
jgi:hypothetical protein